MLIGSQGLNPSIPLCHYCKKPKDEIILTGYEGEKWAKNNGYSDGQMPKYIMIENDIEPCEECKSKGVCFIEFDGDNLTGNYWLIKEESVKMILKDNILERVLKERVCMIDMEMSEKLKLR